MYSFFHPPSNCIHFSALNGVTVHLGINFIRTSTAMVKIPPSYGVPGGPRSKILYQYSDAFPSFSSFPSFPSSPSAPPFSAAPKGEAMLLSLNVSQTIETKPGPSHPRAPGDKHENASKLGSCRRVNRYSRTVYHGLSSLHCETNMKHSHLT